MAKRTGIDEHLTIGDPPSVDDLRQLEADGFRSVVDLRADEEGPLRPDQEALQARGMGLSYHHLPLSPEERDFRRLDEARELLTAARKPCYLHGGEVDLARALILIGRGIDEDWSGQEALARGRAEGLEVRQEGLRRVVEDYVDLRRGPEREGQPPFRSSARQRKARPTGDASEDELKVTEEEGGGREG